MLTARERWDAFMSGVSAVPAPVVPLAERLAARISGMTLQEMQADASHWVASLGGLQKLLVVDALAVGVDASLGAEAFGHSVHWHEQEPMLPATPPTQVREACSSSGRYAQALAVIRRLCQSSQGSVGCIAMMTGPITLAQQLYGSADDHLVDVKPLSIVMAEQLCHARPDLLLLREGGVLGQGDITVAHRKSFNTIKNMAAYFDVPVGLYIEDYSPEMVGQLDQLKLPFLWLGHDANGGLVSPEVARELASQYTGIGLPLDFSSADKSLRQAAQYVDSLVGCNYLLSSDGDLPADLELELLIAAINVLRN